MSERPTAMSAYRTPTMSPLTRRSTFSTARGPERRAGPPRRSRSSLRLLQLVRLKRQVRPLHERRLAHRLAHLGELVGDVGDVDPLVIADARLGGELEGPAYAREAHRLH